MYADRTPLLVGALLGTMFAPITLGGEISVEPTFSSHYTVFDLGSVPGIPGPYGGIAFHFGTADRLLIGGDANDPDGAIYEIEVERGCSGDVIGFVGTATRIATAEEIDGGLVYGPDDVLFYSTYSSNRVGQIMPGAEQAERIFDLEDFGVDSSTGTLMFVPEGFQGAGRLKLTTLDTNGWYDAIISTDGAGKPFIEAVAKISIVPGGPDGAVYVAAEHPQFDRESVLVAAQRAGRIDAYEINENGDPIVETRRAFIRGLSGARGMATDPMTSDVLAVASGGSGNHILLVRGFAGACAADIAPEGGNDVIDTDDLIQVLGAWGDSCSHADINNDGVVNFNDVGMVLSTWGVCE